LLSFLEEIKED